MSRRARAPDPRADPWWEFVRGCSEDSGSAFYFERGESPGVRGHAACYGFAPRDREVWEEARDVRRTSSGLGARTSRSKEEVVVGFAGFDAVGLFEPLLLGSTPRGSPFPLAVWDHYPRAERRSVPSLRNARAAPGLPEEPRLGAPKDRSSPSSFGSSVERIREAIYDGEAFQVVLAHRRERAFRGSLLPLVDRLRREERYAFLYFLRIADGTGGPSGPIEIAGASPESVVEVRGRFIAVNPIAGTRPFPAPSRGPGARLPLDKDPKELAEHRMLVDLARNDIGRVARTGSVRLSRREVRVPYARLEHLVSRVVGTLPEGLNPMDALVSTFPAGTVSGAPKIRATEILRREEGTWRGPYAGAVGLVQGANADFALAIRSAFASGGRVFTGAGAGIVHLSDPRREWEETLTKLAMVESALDPARRRRTGGTR